MLSFLQDLRSVTAEFGAFDADSLKSWDEAAHPRAGNGQFGSGSSISLPFVDVNEAVFHGTNRESGAYIREHGFGTSARHEGGISNDEAGFTFVSPKKAVARYYAEDNTRSSRHGGADVVETHLAGRLVEFDKPTTEAGAIAAIAKEVGAYDEKTSIYDAAKVKNELIKRGFVGFKFKDKHAGNRLAYGIVDTASLAKNGESDSLKRFDPTQTRGDDGRWTAGASAGRGEKATRDLRAGTIREAREKHGVAVPKGSTDVKISDDVNADVVATYTPKGGKKKNVPVYHADYTARQKKSKFDRVAQLHKDLPAIDARLSEDIAAGGKDHDTAMALRLITKTGLRNGGEGGGGKVAAFGATSLLASHATVKGDKVILDFPGKDGVRNRHAFTDPVLTRHIEAKKAAGETSLFDTNDSKARDYMSKISDGDYKVHDLRTMYGSSLAAERVSKMPAPKDAAEAEKMRKQVGYVVSQHLGHEAYNREQATAKVNADAAKKKITLSPEKHKAKVDSQIVASRARATKMSLENYIHPDVFAHFPQSETKVWDDELKFVVNQPRDEEGKWTVIGGHRVSITGKKIRKDQIEHAVVGFALPKDVHRALHHEYMKSQDGIQNHPDAKLHTDDHLYRTIAHAQHLAHTRGEQISGAHIREALNVHGKGGTHEGRRFAPLTMEQRAAPHYPSHALTQDEFMGVATIHKGARNTLVEAPDGAKVLLDNEEMVMGSAAEAKKDAHRVIVEKALKDGKTVPEHVLKDYRDLKQKYHGPPSAGADLGPFKTIDEQLLDARLQMARDEIKKYDARQPRDDSGKWSHADGQKRKNPVAPLLTTKSIMPDETLIAYGAEIKAVEETPDSYKFGAYLVVFDSPDVSRHRDHFTKSTDYGFIDGETRPLMYNHGLDGTIGKTTIGRAQLFVKDDGVWMSGEIRKRRDYLEKHIDRIGHGLTQRTNIKGHDLPVFGTSSGATAHSVIRERAGDGHEIKQWHIGEASITPTPAEPLTGCGAIKSLGEIKADSAINDDVEDLRNELLGTDDGTDTWPLIFKALKAAKSAIPPNVGERIERPEWGDEDEIESVAKPINAVCEFLNRIYGNNNDDEPAVAEAVARALAILKGQTRKPQRVNEQDEMFTSAKMDGPFKFASTQIHLPPNIGDWLMKWGTIAIPDDALAEKGRETEPHVTVLYGLENDDREELQELVSGFGPIRLQLGETACFEAQDYDVVYCAVKSSDLFRLRGRLETLPHTLTHATYTPHATIAYVKSGMGKLFTGRYIGFPVDATIPLPVQSDDIALDVFYLSDKNGDLRPISTCEKAIKSGRVVSSDNHAHLSELVAKAKGALGALEAWLKEHGDKEPFDLRALNRGFLPAYPASVSMGDTDTMDTKTAADFQEFQEFKQWQESQHDRADNGEFSGGGGSGGGIKPGASISKDRVTALAKQYGVKENSVAHSVLQEAYDKGHIKTAADVHNVLSNSAKDGHDENKLSAHINEHGSGNGKFSSFVDKGAGKDKAKDGKPKPSAADKPLSKKDTSSLLSQAGHSPDSAVSAIVTEAVKKGYIANIVDMSKVLHEINKSKGTVGEVHSIINLHGEGSKNDGKFRSKIIPATKSQWEDVPADERADAIKTYLENEEIEGRLDALLEEARTI